MWVVVLVLLLRVEAGAERSADGSALTAVVVRCIGMAGVEGEERGHSGNGARDARFGGGAKGDERVQGGRERGRWQG